MIERAIDEVGALVRSGLDAGRFARELVGLLRAVVPHAAARVVTVDPATGLLAGMYKFGCLAGNHELDGTWAALEYGTDDPMRMSVISCRELPAMATSQLVKAPHASTRVRDLVEPAGCSDELRMVALHDHEPWGGIDLFRAAGQDPFDEDEVSLLAALSSPVAEGLRAGMFLPRQTTPHPTHPAGPAVIIVGDGGSPLLVSVGTEELLDEITSEPHRAPAESLVRSLTVAARRFAAGERAELPRCRLLSPSGQWLVAHAAPLARASGTTGEVVITIDEARPPDVMPLLAAALGLTDREREVTQLVLGGVDTKGIAAALSMSAYTVQDHLKSIFDKADVRSRRELVARVFFDHCSPRLTETSPPAWPALSARAS